MKEEKYILKYKKKMLNQGSWSGILSVEENFENFEDASKRRETLIGYIKAQTRDFQTFPIAVQIGESEYRDSGFSNNSCIWAIEGIEKISREVLLSG